MYISGDHDKNVTVVLALTVLSAQYRISNEQHRYQPTLPRFFRSSWTHSFGCSG
jgi:hypothetical protein